MKSDELNLIESKTGVVLPNSYKQALLNYPETLIGTEAEDFHFLTNANEIISENLEVRENGYFGKKWPDRYFIIGNNGCGDYYVINHTNTKFSVGLADHDQMECNLFANNLSEFVERLLNEFEAEEDEHNNLLKTTCQRSANLLGGLLCVYGGLFTFCGMLSAT